jgi:hypothetical protein
MSRNSIKRKIWRYIFESKQETILLPHEAVLWGLVLLFVLYMLISP